VSQHSSPQLRASYAKSPSRLDRGHLKSTGAKRRVFFPSVCHNALYNARRDLADSSPF
jgi:hypothetical protein